MIGGRHSMGWHDQDGCVTFAGCSAKQLSRRLTLHHGTANVLAVYASSSVQSFNRLNTENPPSTGGSQTGFAH